LRIAPAGRVRDHAKVIAATRACGEDIQVHVADRFHTAKKA
jgi:hypothetical protein